MFLQKQSHGAPEAARGDDEKGENALEEKERGDVLPDISVVSCACTCVSDQSSGLRDDPV